LEKVPLSGDQWKLGACHGSVVQHNVCKPIQFPSHDHLNVIHGEGIIALEFEYGLATLSQDSSILQCGQETTPDLLIADLGDGTTLSGICMALAGTKTQVIGAAPRAGFWEHASRQHTSDVPVSKSYGQKYWEGTKTPMAAIPWATFTAPGRLSRILEVDDEQMYAASIVARERYSLCLEPHEVVPLAVVLYNPDLQEIMARVCKDMVEPIVGVILQSRRINSVV
jgi:threonine dehydratase